MRDEFDNSCDVHCGLCGAAYCAALSRNLVEFRCDECGETNWVLELGTEVIVVQEPTLEAKKQVVVAMLLSHLGVSTGGDVHVTKALLTELFDNTADREQFHLLFTED